MEYEVIRSNRKTLSLEVRQGKVIVRSPLWIPSNQISAFVAKSEHWIQSKLTSYELKKEKAEEAGILTESELLQLREEAKKIIPERVSFYAASYGISYGKVTIRAQRSKWGSCSSKGNLSFNCLLLLTPAEVLDSVVVHELCHRYEMNHSEEFYSEVLRIYPSYWKWNRWLKENGDILMSRLPK